MDKKLLVKKIDEVLVKNINYIPEEEREVLIKKIMEAFIGSIIWIDIMKDFRCIIENNKNSSLCQSVFCVNYIKRIFSCCNNY